MINFTEDNTKDSDFRVLGGKEERTVEPCVRDEAQFSENGNARKETHLTRQGSSKGCLTTALIILALILAAGGFFLFKGMRVNAPVPEVPTVFEPETVQEDIMQPQEADEGPATLSQSSDSITTAYTEHIQKTINDIPLDIYIPHNAQAQLMIGTPGITDESIIFATQAADIRADNGKIVGAFVTKGEPLSYGLSKKGYCGIINDRISVGVAENSPLFEEATDKEGYFFRQYPLVDNGTLVENEPKGKSVRKALCQKAGETFIVFTGTPESFHDFSQALVDLGVDNAIYLVGSEYSYGFTRDIDGNAQQFAERISRKWKYENYLVWKVM